MEAYLPFIYSYLFIFTARVADMSLDVIRVLMLMRGKKVYAAIIGFVEVSIFILALNQVLSGGLHDIGKIIAYAGGFATGNYVGVLLENKLAIGYATIQVFPQKHCVQQIIAALREQGFGVTSVRGEGRDGERIILFVTLKRKDMPEAVKLLEKIEPCIFYSVVDTRQIHGGVFPGKN
ncbi:MAG: DUF2179 domain-containing protein [Desulfurispora sp.]|uniref:DUF2179 domain-containing protein n=1 Tax=Desulfurispora sp. TaxID=3014275 RepID=UPI00404B6246